VVRPGEQVVVRRLGRVVVPVWGPGFHWGLPPEIDRRDRVRTDQVRRLVVGPADTPEVEAEVAGGEYLTGDLNLVRIQAVVQYRVEDPVDFVVRGESAEGLFRKLAEASLTASLGRRGIDTVLRGGRQSIADEVEASLGEAVRLHRLGLSILGVGLTDTRPPAEVAEDFVAAQAAENRRDRRANEARTTAETALTSARAEARARIERARSAAHRKLLASRAEAKSFIALSAEADKSRPLTLRRIYIDAMRSLLAGVGRKVVLPPGDAVDLTVLGVDE
jgi:membrane protease subunit HflK